eukprot:641386-Pyramimonas_sp.AAC.1
MQEIRKDIDEALDLFPAFLVKLTAGRIPVAPPAGNRFQPFRAGLFLPREAPKQRSRARYGTKADLVSGSPLAPPLSV